MPTPLRRRLRMARRGAWYAIAICVVLMALMAGVLSQLLPLVQSHPDHLAAWLSERAGRPVSFDSVETRWTRLGPLLRLDGMRVGTGRRSVLIGDAEMLVSQYAGLLPGRSFTELRLRGLDLTMEQGRDGRWTVRGLPGQTQQSGADPFGPLEGLGELQVIGGKLSVVAPALGIQSHLPRVDMRLRVDGHRVRIGARAWAQLGRAPLLGVADFDRTTGNGRMYASATHAELDNWTSLLHAVGVSVTGGDGRVDAWARLQGHRMTQVTVNATLAQLQLRGAPLLAAPPGTPDPSLHFDAVQANVRWRAMAGGWRVDAPLLRVAGTSRTQNLDGLVVEGGQRFGLLARHLDAGPVVAVAALSDRLDPGLRRWLLAARPDGVLTELLIAGDRQGALRARARIDDLAFAPVGRSPGLSKLAGWLEGDARAARFRFDPAHPVRVDWIPAFGEPRSAAVEGEVDGWRDDAGWHAATPSLRIASSGVAATVRGGLHFGADTGPHLDLAAQLDDFPAAAAKAFWIRHLMSPGIIAWLDAALMGGRVHDGRVLVSGDLRDWPFVARDGHPANGAFEATAQLQSATLKFQSGWPPFDHVDADVAFVGEGFHVGGKGVLAGVGVRRFDAGIARFSVPALTVHADGGGDASRLLGLLRQSPLHAQYGETLDNVEASGLASVTFDLTLPFVKQAGANVMAGTVALSGAHLAEKRWNIAFDNVRGRANYGSGGFEADKLAVVRDGKPGRLSLRAGAYTHARSQAFEADLDASLSADDLASRAPALDWLKPYLDGSSTWTVGVAIPRAAAANAPALPSHLQLRSNLVGTAISLPAPLRKAAATELPAFIDAALPMGSGDVTVSLGKLMALRARSSRAANGAEQTGVRVALGSSVVAEAPPASGLIATGRADALDALDWIAVTRGDGHGTNPMPLRNIDVTASRLRLLGADFADTRLQVEPAAGGTDVQLQGDALAGSVRIPDGEGATVTGRLQRVKWPGFVIGSSTPTPAATTTATSTVDPAKVPPLAFDIADLRIGGAPLGAVSLRTQPVAGGLHIQQLQTRTPGQRIDVHGDWIGRGSSARTQLQVTADSTDFGVLLAGLGYGGQLSAGHGTASLTTAWPGSPSDFHLAALTGSLHLAIRDGQLVQVQPGAGRVLGLLSLAQLPRRLTLDFHDFFEKGFAFDKVDGDDRIGGGLASSDNLVIDGPAAEIRIRGAANLMAQQYDQTILVLPKAGNLLTAVGAIAGGPVGAAIGAAANQMLKKPLGRLAAKTYRVTGPWKDPKVEVVGREESSRNTLAVPSPR